MTKYTRITQERTFESLSPDLAGAIASHLEQYGIDDALPFVTGCIETTSTCQTRRLFKTSTQTTISAVVVTPKWLIWGSRVDADLGGVLSARLADVRVTDYEASPAYRLIPDGGVDIHGRFTNALEVSSCFVGLGPEPAATRFRDIVREAINNAR